MRLMIFLYSGWRTLSSMATTTVLSILSLTTIPVRVFPQIPFAHNYSSFRYASAPLFSFFFRA